MQILSLDFIIDTEHLRLRAPRLSDAAFIFSAAQTEGFTDTMDWPTPKSERDVERSLAQDLQQWQKGVSFIFTVEHKNSAVPLARVAVIQAHWPVEWNFGFWVHPDYWGRGYATQASNAVIQCFFDRFKLEKLMTDHIVGNLASQRVIEKLGFEFVRENSNGWKKNGRKVCLLEYVLYNPLL